MKRRTTFMVMALAAMFAFSTPAEAQFGLGKLARKARKAVGLQTQQDKYEDFREQQQKEEKIRKQKQDSIQAAINSITPTIPQPAKTGALNAIKWGDTKIGTWDPVNLEITFNQTYDEGEFAGQKVSYKLDPATGKWKSKKGTDVGQMSNDGTIISPNLGTIKYDPEKNTVSMNGEVIGKVNLKTAYVFDKTIGSFEGHVSPLLVAFTFHGSLISKKQITDWKEAKLKAEQEAKERAERERQARIEREEALKKEWAALNMEITNSSYSTLGYIRANGEVEDRSHSTLGYIKMNGTVENRSHSTLGYVKDNGEVENSSHSTIGYYRNGCFEDRSHSTIGYFRNGDVENRSHSTIGKIKGGSNNTIVAAAFYFFYFKDQIPTTSSSSYSSSSSSSSSSSKQSVELFRRGSQFGEIRPNGDIYMSGTKRGEVRSSGDIYVNGSSRGEVRSNGDIYKNGSKMGEVRSNGEIYINGSRKGEVRSNGDIYINGSCVGEARHMTSSDVRAVAVIYFFEFY